MSRILHLECSTGASGDKVLGALLEVCETLGLATFDDLVKLATAIAPRVHIERTHVVRGGVGATHIVIEEPDAPVRHWSEIRTMIEEAKAAGVLTSAAAALALSAFELVAKAEATVHNQTLDHVHFHEVGAADSIIDIVGSSFLLDALAPQAVYATPLALGSGTLVCAHGELPVPAPATARIIEGLPVYAGAFSGELTTPTGAALVRTFVTHFEVLPQCTVCALGYGAGSREIRGASNVVRALVGKIRPSEEPCEKPSGKAARYLRLAGCALLESNIDHRTPEALAYICDELLRLGALDVWQEPIAMKKGRLGVKLCLLCSSADARKLSEVMVKKTGTLGVRRRYVERIIAAREQRMLDTPYGPVPYKIARYIEPDGDSPLDANAPWLRPEFDAVSALARKHSLDYQQLYDELMACGLAVRG